MNAFIISLYFVILEKGEKGVEVVSFPIPFPVAREYSGKAGPGLGLTTGDLKVFSGHALNLLKSKCSKVDPKVIFQIQKYFAKQIAAKADPVRGDNAKFREVLKTITTCSQEKVLALPKLSEPFPLKQFLQPKPQVEAKEAADSSDSDESSSSEEDKGIRMDSAPEPDIKIVQVIPHKSVSRILNIPVVTL